MPKKRPGFTKAKHAEVGRKLKEIRQVLHTLSVEIPNAYGLTGKLGRLTDRAVNAVDKLRNELDTALVNESSPEEWSRDRLDNVYFGKTEERP